MSSLILEFPQRFAILIIGVARHRKSSGKTMSINIEDRWNWVTHPASFQFIDSLPVYRILRIANGKDSSYALDSHQRTQPDQAEV